MAGSFQRMIKRLQDFMFGEEKEAHYSQQTTASNSSKKLEAKPRVLHDQQSGAKIFHQYPKQGKFRFPMDVDDKKTKLTNYREQKRPSRTTTSRSEVSATTTDTKHSNQSRSFGRQAEKTNNKTETEEKRKYTEKEKEVSSSEAFTKQQTERTYFQGNDFAPEDIPSPVFGFEKVPLHPENLKKKNESIEPLSEQIRKEPEPKPNEDKSEPVIVSEEAFLSFYNDKQEVFEDAKNKRIEEQEAEEKNSSKPVLVTEETSSIKGGREAFEDEKPSDVNYYSKENEQEVFEDIENKRIEEQEAEEKNSSEPVLVTEETSSIKGGREAFEDEKPSSVNQYSKENEKAVPGQEEGKPETAKQTRVENHSVRDKADKKDENKKKMNKKQKPSIPFNVLMYPSDKYKKHKKGAKTNNYNGLYQFPGLHLLNVPPKKEDNGGEALQAQRDQLEATLHNFNVNAKVVDVTKGPSVTRFEVQPAPGVKVNKITNLTDDIKLALAAKDLRMEAPIPGKNAIGIEVPNSESTPVFLREILRRDVFTRSESPLTVAMGLDISGTPIVADLQKMPHGLIAGATGSGKSVCINSILLSLLYKASPEELKLMLIDPKMVELASFKEVPHLVTPVINDAKEATAGLKWAVSEMEGRYEKLAHEGVRDIKKYNERMVQQGCPELKMPYIVIIIDELADLMMVSPQDVEDAVCRIAQKARACGIHLLLATQRPSVDVITGLIKANIPSRTAFAVSSQADSRTILDMGGAERLIGKGDMLFHENGTPKPVRVQGTFVTDEEIDAVTDFIKKQRKPSYMFNRNDLMKKVDQEESGDELFPEACKFIAEQGSASSSSLQRRFSIGYNRAAKLIDMMENRGIISESMGSKPRRVLMSYHEIEENILT
ncbi:DNA translocase FtsK [Alteribacillus bidgolensis]|uniref:DNA translocase FtsK n=1 Tax=Alteribacillus bidgolensis TaxID=930129 RepID=A0A1G8ES85_9BACI|nr:DNA translocase FtsK [Alteribacillus bidgolensis]SDH72735.1 DNA translocase FtsK [Alteribacillus bidgolensis]